ncbi:Uncaracterized surface protein containing fasciclin (FAS1) repeats [Filimonas lacunae]|uniref:Uncaracterized surface protein containing fasciclin (FAS1) repeats n=1 Tax=Filimonas lacunae TaxID=477680 RepID=A0A173MAR8_9BACT|nr:fasciclin domain-containing protein [Filimonas lacunae]BAV04558.1 hypothetical protein FLA_0550 [Filimonas lacunae]SIT34768.1 Uncaracterized surface protein containing fasciclin (FAS1) repeats [Filimonas lacunae]
MRYGKYYWWLLLFTGFIACKKWSDHTEVKEQALNQDLMEQISSRSNLSLFKTYLVKTGLDKELTASKNFTVFAPVDAVLKNLDAAVVNNTDSLRKVLLNHIAGQLYFTRMANDSVRAYMLNGKRVFFYQQHFDDANITEGDIYVKNGVLQIIDKVVPPLPNAWQLIDSLQDVYAQNAYIARLTYQKQDPTKAEVDSINPITGEIVYKPGTGIVTVNTFTDKVYNLDNEDSLYTYLVLDDNAYATEKTRQKPFFKSTDAVITEGNAAWNVVKDLAIKGLYSIDKLPDTLLSKFNVRVPVSKANIVATHKVSNGIVYVLSASASPMKDKIPECIVQGENPFAFKGDVISKTFYRIRNNPNTGKSFNDMYIQSPGASFYVEYITNEVYTAKYKVYWVALSDYTYRTDNDDYTYGTTTAFQQRLAMDSSANATSLPYTAVNPYTYTETYLGEYTKGSYDFPIYILNRLSGNVVTPATVHMYLTAAASTPNYLSLDYIKLVPVLE